MFNRCAHLCEGQRACDDSNANSTANGSDAEMEWSGGENEDCWIAIKLKQDHANEVTGFGGPSKVKTGKKSKKPQLNFQKWFNQAIYFHQVGRLREAESIYKKMIAAGSSDPAVFCNLGILCKTAEDSQKH